MQQQRLRINLKSFLEDTKNLIKEGCHRKATLQFQLFPISSCENVTRDQYYQFYHRQAHALIKILTEYRGRSGNHSSKPIMIKTLYQAIRSWTFLFSKDTESDDDQKEKQLRLLRKYFTLTGVILLHEQEKVKGIYFNRCQNLEQTKEMVRCLFRFDVEVLYEMKDQMIQCLYYKVLLHYHAAVILQKFSCFDQSLLEFMYVIHEYQVILPSIMVSEPQKKTKINKHKYSLYDKFVQINVMSLLQMSYIFENDYKMLHAKECIIQGQWFSKCYFDSEKQLQAFLAQRVNEITTKYSQFIQDNQEVERLLKKIYPNYVQLESDSSSGLFTYFNTQLYKKYDYGRLQNNQYFKQQSMAVLPEVINSTITKKLNRCSTTKTSLLKSHDLGSTLTTSRNESGMKDSGILILNTIKVQQLKTISQVQQPLVKAPEEEDELHKFLSTFADREEITDQPIQNTVEPTQPQPKEPKARQDKNFHYTDEIFDIMIRKKLDENLACEEYGTMVAKILGEIEKQRKLCDKTMFGLKFLNQKKKNCKIHGHEPGAVSNINTMHFKIKTELKVEREANNQMNIIIAKNKVAPIITALIKPPITDIDDPLYIEQTPAKRAQQILLKHSNKLGLQSFKRELKRNNNISSHRNNGSLHKEEEEIISNETKQKEVHKLNKQVLLRMMDEYETEFQIKQPLNIRQKIMTQEKMKDVDLQVLGRSTYLNFVQDNLKKAGASGKFTDLVMAQFRVVQSLKLKKNQSTGSIIQEV